MMRATTLFLLTITLLLSGCQLLPQKKSVQFTPIQQAQAQLNDWAFVGKLGVRYGNHASQGTLLWQHHTADFELRLQGPLGIQLLQLIGNDTHAQIITPRETFEGDNPDELIKKILGWPLPIRAMQWWMKGLPDPTLSLEKTPVFDNQGYFQQAQQQGWQIEWSDYQIQTSQLALPHRITLENGRLHLTMVIHTWQL